MSPKKRKQEVKNETAPVFPSIDREEFLDFKGLFSVFNVLNPVSSLTSNKKGKKNILLLSDSDSQSEEQRLKEQYFSSVSSVQAEDSV